MKKDDVSIAYITDWLPKGSKRAFKCTLVEQVHPGSFVACRIQGQDGTFYSGTTDLAFIVSNDYRERSNACFTLTLLLRGTIITVERSHNGYVSLFVGPLEEEPSEEDNL